MRIPISGKVVEFTDEEVIGQGVFGNDIPSLKELSKSYFSK